MDESIYQSAAEFSSAQAETDRKQTAFTSLGFGALTLASYEFVETAIPNSELSDALRATVLGFGTLAVVTTVVTGTLSGIAWQLDARRHRRRAITEQSSDSIAVIDKTL